MMSKPHTIGFDQLKYFLLVAFGILSQFIASSQTPAMLLLTPDSSYKQKDGLFRFYSEGAIGSNVLDNHFMKKSFFGGHIERDHIAGLKEDMTDRNRAGFLMNAGLDVYNLKDTLFNRPHWGLRVGLSTNYHATMSFSKDMFSLIYQGNKGYLNDTASLGPFYFQYQSWQKVGLGIFNKHTLSSVSISLVEGQSYHSFLLDEGDLYTSQNGDSLSFSYQGDYWRSDTTKTGPMNGSGLGAAIDVEYNLPLADHQGVISIAVYDAGFIVWNRMSEHFEFDSLTTWKGVNVNDVFSLTDDSLGIPNLNDTLQYRVSKKAYVAPLPMSIHLRYVKHFSRGNFYEAGLSMWPNRAAVPRVHAGLTHFITQHFSVSERITYGGYSRFGLGAELNWMPCGTWLFRVGTQHIGGFTSGRAYGRDYYFTIAKSF